MAGTAVALATLFAFSVLMIGDGEAYAEFVRNTAKHTGTPLTNYIGMPTLASSSGSTLSEAVLEPRRVDPYVTWKQLRLQNLNERRLLHWSAVGLLLLATAAVCLRVREPWKLVIAGLVPMFCLFDLTNYYYSVLIVLAPLAVGRPLNLTVLAALTLGSHVIHQHTLDLVEFPLYSMMVLAVLLYFLGVLVHDARRANLPVALQTPALRDVPVHTSSISPTITTPR
jgi:hypothetical protein